MYNLRSNSSFTNRIEDLTSNANKSAYLPGRDALLLIADIFLNSYRKHRNYDTVAVGAIGKRIQNTYLVAGINSSKFDETAIGGDVYIPARIRNNVLFRRLQVIPLREPYHAETSIVLAAKDAGMKVFGIAATRTVCRVCRAFFKRHQSLLHEDCYIVDNWRCGSQFLTQKERMKITNRNWPLYDCFDAVKRF